VDGDDAIRRYRTAILARDFETAAALLHADLAFYAPKPGVVFNRDQLLEMWSEPDEEREHLTSEFELGEVETLPDGRYFSTARETNRWRDSGEVAAVIERATIWRLRDGKIEEIRMFPTVDAGRAAVSAS
jgi:hypothetical protein